MKNYTPKRRRRDHQKQSAWAKSLIPLLHQKRDEAAKAERQERTVPEISVKAWTKIEPLLKEKDCIDIYDLTGATGMGREWISRKGFMQAIVDKFPNEWAISVIGLPEGGWRKVLRRRVSP